MGFFLTMEGSTDVGPYMGNNYDLVRFSIGIKVSVYWKMIELQVVENSLYVV